MFVNLHNSLRCVHNTFSAYRRNKHIDTHRNGIFLPKNKKSFAHKMFERAIKNLRNNIITIISSDDKQKFIEYCQNSKDISNANRQIIDIVLSHIGSKLRVVN